jgi:hypothetical protein
MYLAIAIAEMPYLIKNKCKKELTIFSVLFILGFTYLMLTATDVPMPKIMPLIDWFFENVLHIGYEK